MPGLTPGSRYQPAYYGFTRPPMPEGCYVDSTRPCIWHRIYERAERMGRTDKLMEILPPLDWSRTGGETWIEVGRKVRERGYYGAAIAIAQGAASRRSAISICQMEAGSSDPAGRFLLDRDVSLLMEAGSSDPAYGPRESHDFRGGFDRRCRIRPAGSEDPAFT
jgi:hypothetical protein